MYNILPLAAIVISYFLGNISPSILIGKAMGVDIRKEGSGNAGTTNTLRVIGKKAAAAVLAIDVLKGVAAVLLGRYIGGQELAMYCGLVVFLGHIWPAAFGFRGGKGIATAFGVALAWEPLLGLLELAIAAIFFVTAKRVSVGSIVAAIAFPIVAYNFDHNYLPVTTVMGIIVLVKHRKNIVRLVKGEEPKVSFKKQEGKK
jgi:glycerol-3-phosphate acyltransferase PlsY